MPKATVVDMTGKKVGEVELSRSEEHTSELQSHLT